MLRVFQRSPATDAAADDKAPGELQRKKCSSWLRKRRLRQKRKARRQATTPAHPAAAGDHLNPRVAHTDHAIVLKVTDPSGNTWKAMKHGWWVGSASAALYTHALTVRVMGSNKAHRIPLSAITSCDIERVKRPALWLGKERLRVVWDLEGLALQLTLTLHIARDPKVVRMWWERLQALQHTRVPQELIREWSGLLPPAEAEADGEDEDRPLDLGAAPKPMKSPEDRLHPWQWPWDWRTGSRPLHSWTDEEGASWEFDRSSGEGAGALWTDKSRWGEK